eukprot:comp12881_c0_seq1/m.17274 comp12881_c0_seq1/g.17274  ORF comp12881_c0_seq1/g.17274 comp12881_c0_seq1/m.17274 type:complete len:176 (-) comp12881_c0_seq1:42-569(-)
MVAYEMSLIANSKLPTSSIFDLLHSLTRKISDLGGTVTRLENLGIRILAQSKTVHQTKHTQGRFLLLTIEAAPVIMKEVETALKTDTRTIYHSFYKLNNGIPCLRLIRKKNRQNEHFAKLEGLKELARTKPMFPDARLGSTTIRSEEGIVERKISENGPLKYSAGITDIISKKKD